MFKYELIGNPIGFNSNIMEIVLNNRGIENIKSFLNPSEKDLEDANNYMDIESWITLYLNHIQSNSRILLIVDADFDGFSSASLMYQYTKCLNKDAEIDFLVHEGKKHGMADLMDKILEIKDKLDLVIMFDASSNEEKEHKILIDNNIDVLVADHHETTNGRYGGQAIVVNNQISNKIKNKALTGVGVVYKICKEIDNRLKVNYADNFLDLVSCGMIADMSDLRNLESRYLVNLGMEQMKQGTNKNKLIKELVKKQSYSMKNTVNIIGISFYICPLINALTRVGTLEENRILFEAMCNMDRIMTDKVRGKGEVEMTLQEYAIRKCESAKRKQKKYAEEGEKDIIEQIEKFNMINMPILVVNGNSIQKSLTGLVANKIVPKYQRPCLILKDNKEHYSGSGRGFAQSPIKDFKKWCNETNLFVYNEGHDNAFGSSISKDKINLLYDTIKQLPISTDLIYRVDGILNGNTIHRSIVESIVSLENIWGTTVKEPLFAIEHIQVSCNDVINCGKTLNTLKFTHNEIEFVTFNSSKEQYEDIIKEGKDIEFTIIGNFKKNAFGGKSIPQVMITDFSYKSVDIKFKF